MKTVQYGNRGKSFEMDLILTNTIYKHRKWAFIEKTEPNFKCLPNAHLPSKWKNGKNHYHIGYYGEKGFVDFFGICQGKSLAFEAKSTKNQTRFPLDNFSEKQIEDLKYWQELGGISFALISFEKKGEVYLMMFEELKRWWDDAKKGGRKSIPYEWFKMNIYQVKMSRGVVWDYLKGLGIN